MRDERIVPIFVGEGMVQRYIHALDEVNRMAAVSYRESGGNVENVIGDILSLLIAAYRHGIEDIADMLMYRMYIDLNRMNNAIYKNIGGKTFEDRVRDHMAADDPKGLQMLAESEYHRVYSQAEFDGAEDYEADTGLTPTKKWNTMNDNDVRETHDFLEGVSVDLHEEFHTVDGDHALVPGGFEKAENNAGCRCWLTFGVA